MLLSREFDRSFFRNEDFLYESSYLSLSEIRVVHFVVRVVECCHVINSFGRNNIKFIKYEGIDKGLFCNVRFNGKVYKNILIL